MVLRLVFLMCVAQQVHLVCTVHRKLHVQLEDELWGLALHLTFRTLKSEFHKSACWILPLLALLVSYSATGAGQNSDINLIGAQVKGHRVIADVGGNLNIESLQDTSSYNSKQKNAGFSLALSPTGIPVGGSINGGRCKINSDYQSVNELSGIFADDGGFDVNVAGNTDFKNYRFWC